MTRLLRRRIQQGLTQSELAGRAGITIQTYQHYERGSRVPNAVVGCRLAMELHTTPQDLFSVTSIARAGSPEQRRARLKSRRSGGDEEYSTYPGQVPAGWKTSGKREWSKPKKNRKTVGNNMGKFDGVKETFVFYNDWMHTIDEAEMSYAEFRELMRIVVIYSSLQEMRNIT